MTNCQECTASVSDTAPSCPRCGAPAAVAFKPKASQPDAMAAVPLPSQSVQSAGSSWWKWVLGVPVILFVAFMALGALVSSGKPDSHLVYERNVRDLLRDGGAAEFSGVTKYKSGWVCGNVNGKNAFGAYVGFRGFVVGPGGRAYIEDASPTGSQVFSNLRASNCRD